MSIPSYMKILVPTLRAGMQSGRFSSRCDKYRTPVKNSCVPHGNENADTLSIWKSLKACFFIFAVFVVVSAIVFQAKDSDAKQTRQDNTLKEHIIRIPVSDMKAVTDKQAEGIFIPYSEYRDLYERAKKAFFSKKGEKNNMMPSQMPFITQAIIKGKYRKNLIRFSASFIIVNNREEPVKMPLSFKKVKLRTISLNKNPVHLEDKNGIPIILISEPGVHELSVEFDVDVRFHAKKAVVEFEIPEPVMGEIEIVSTDMADIRFSGLPMMAKTPISVLSSHIKFGHIKFGHTTSDHMKPGQIINKNRYKIAGFIGQQSQISVLIDQKALREDTGQYISSMEQHRLYVSDDIINARLDYKIDVKGAALAHLNLEIPSMLHILDLSGPAISGWKRFENTVRVDFYTPVTRSTRMKIKAYQYMNSNTKSGTAADVRASYKDIKIEDLFKRRGELAIYYADHIRMKIENHANCRIFSDSYTTGANDPDFPADKYTLFRRYQLFHLPAKIDFSISKPKSSIFVAVQQSFKISKSKLTLDAQLTLSGFLKPVSRFVFSWPSGYFVKKAEAVINGKKIIISHEKDAAGKSLIVETGKYAGMKDSIRFIFQSEMIRNFDSEASRFQKVDIPVIMFSDADKIKGTFSILLDEKLEIEDVSVKGLTPSNTNACDARISTPVDEDRLEKFIYDFSAAANVSGVARVVEKKAHVGSQSVIYVSIDEDIIQANAFVRYNISKPGVKDFYIAVSKWKGSKIDIKGADIKEKNRITNISKSRLKEMDSAKKYSDDTFEIWHVILQKEFAGEYVLHVNYQKKAAAFSNFSDLPLPVPLNVGSDNGYIVIEAGPNTDIRVEKEGLNEIESHECPKWPPYEPSRRVIKSLRYFVRSFTCRIKVSAQKEMPVLSAIAQQEKIRIVIGKDSDMFFEYRYLIKNSGLQFLNMTLPVGYTLWGAEINNKGIKPRRKLRLNRKMLADKNLGKNSGNLLIPLPLQNGEDVFNLRLFGIIENTRNQSSWSLNSFQSITMKIPCLESEVEINYPDTWSLFTARGNFPDLERPTENAVFFDCIKTFFSGISCMKYSAHKLPPSVKEKTAMMSRERDQMLQLESSRIGSDVNAPGMPVDRISGMGESKDAMRDSDKGAYLKQKKSEASYVKIKGLSSLSFDFAGSGTLVTFKKNWGNADINIRFIPDGFKQSVRFFMLILFFTIGWFLRKKGVLHPFKYMIFITIIFTLLSYAGTKHLIFVFNGAVQGAFFWWVASIFFRHEKDAGQQHNLAKSAAIICFVIIINPLCFVENADAKKPEVFPETKIYIPYEPSFEHADEFLPDEPGDGKNDPVYIPTQDYFNLKFIADPPDHLPQKEVVFDNPFDIACMETTGQIENDQARFMTRIDLDINRENWVMVQLPFKNIYVDEIKLDSRKVPVINRLDTYEIPVFGKGRHMITITYETRIVSLQGRQKIDFIFPKILCSEFVINLSAKDVITDIAHPGSGYEIKKNMTGHEINFSGAGQNRFSMSWFPRRVSDIKQAPLNFIECRVRMFMEEDHLNFNQNCVIRTEKGIPGSISFTMPPELIVEDLVSESVREWKIDRINGQFILFVIFKQDVKSQNINLEIKGKQFITPKKSVDVLFLKPFPVHRIHGTLEIYGNRQFKVLVNDIKNLKPSFKDGNTGNKKSRIRGSWQMKKRFDFISSDIHAEILYQAVEKFATGKISYGYHVFENRIYLKLAADIDVRSGAIDSISFKMPEGYMVSEIRAKDISDPVIDQKQSPKKEKFAHIFFRHSVKGKIKVYGVFEKPLSDLNKVSIEAVTIDELDKLAGSVVSVFFPEGYKIRQKKIEGITAAAVPGSNRNQADSTTEKNVRYDYDSKTAHFKALFDVEKSDPVVDVVKVNFIKAMDNRIDVRTLCILDIRHAPSDRFLIRIPVFLKDRVNIKGDNISAIFKQEDKIGNVEITVRFAPKIRQSCMLELSYSHYLTDSDDFFLPDISFPEAANTMEFIAVETDTSSPLKPLIEGRLYEIGKERIPALPEGARPENILWAFRSGKADEHRFGVRLERLETEKTVPIRILRQDIESLIVSDGFALNEVKLKIKNRSLQFLPVDFPKGSEIWSVMVAGQPVRPVEGKTDRKGLKSILIPLVKNETGERDFHVRILFVLPLPSTMKTMGNLSPPMIKIPNIAVGKSTWTLFLPEVYTYHKFEHNMNDTSWSLIEADKALELANEFTYWTQIASTSTGGLNKNALDNRQRVLAEFKNQEMQAQNYRRYDYDYGAGRNSSSIIFQAKELIRKNQALPVDGRMHAEPKLPKSKSGKIKTEQRAQVKGWQIQTQSFADQKDVGVSISNLMKVQQDLKSKESIRKPAKIKGRKKKSLKRRKSEVQKIQMAQKRIVDLKPAGRRQIAKEDAYGWDNEKTQAVDIHEDGLYEPMEEMEEPSAAVTNQVDAGLGYEANRSEAEKPARPQKPSMPQKPAPVQQSILKHKPAQPLVQSMLIKGMRSMDIKIPEKGRRFHFMKLGGNPELSVSYIKKSFYTSLGFVLFLCGIIVVSIFILRRRILSNKRISMK
ncbi:hypothetical protein QUF76_03205 [Desulfobacterales bacterium HSG16]|nr:hypothetical protein [Desulfobacterales bacterium HSG16]